MVDLGIHVDGDLDRTLVTLDSVRRAASGRILLLVEPDVPAPPAAALRGVECVRLARAGTATAFNALLESSAAPVVGFLESGAQVASGALARLAGMLGGTVAMAGPSTNLAWNQQHRRDAPPPGSDPDAIERYGDRLLHRHGAEASDLGPLHSLADFCLVVRRETVAGLGGADDAYDPGPCWEMDLNVRAQRAGWQGLWVKAAYVHRAPISERRRDREAEFFLANRRRFQERFCGALLRGDSKDYCPHCLGDACHEFAPTRSILGGASLVRGGRAAIADGPLVSCIMPTRDRPAFVAEAVRGFLGQDYPRRELVVVDDGVEPIAGLLPVDERVVYVRLPERLPIGSKRNIACERARGEIVAHVDDDDWYPPHRLSAQVRALLDGGAAVSGTSALTFHDPVRERAWLYAYPREGWLAGSSLVYRRSYWDRHRFAALQVGEDWRFLEGLTDRRQMIDLGDADLCLATVHERNSSPKKPEAPLWTPLDYPKVAARLGGRAAAYRAAAAGAPARLPLVSCIMPTQGRPEFAALAIQKFQAQDYPDKELIILDDGPLPVAHLARGLPGVRYLRMEGRRATIGEKRNITCDLARGEVVCIWDDDDWYGPERLRCQVLPIAYDEADMTGLRCDHLLCLPSGDTWSVTDGVHRRMFESDVAGGTIAFRRAIFEQVRFPHIDLAEDAAFIRVARARGYRLKHIANHGVFAYVRHPRNTWRFEPGKFYDPLAWRRTELPSTFSRTMLAAHQEACRTWLAR